MKKRYILFSILLLFIFSHKVHASTGYFYFCNSNSNTSMKCASRATFWRLENNLAYGVNSPYGAYYGYYVTDYEFNANQPFGLSFSLDTPLKAGLSYALTIYLGSTNSNTNYRYTFAYNYRRTLFGGTDLTQSALSYQYNSNIIYLHYYHAFTDNLKVVPTGDDDDNYLLDYYSSYIVLFIEPTVDTNTIFVPIQALSSTTSYVVFYGYNIESLGNVDKLTTSDIQNVVSSSGLATASSVSQVQSSVNQVKQELTSLNQAQQQTNNKLDGVNDKLDQVNSTLTDNSSPSLSALENSSGWLPPGPVDSILNIPFSFLNNLTLNLSKSCQPVVLTLPFINSNLTLPCVNNLYEEMGVTTFSNWIGIIASVFILISYLIKLYKWVDDTLSLREKNYLDNWGGL